MRKEKIDSAALEERVSAQGLLVAWLTVPQVAEKLGLCTATVYDLIRREVLPATHVGRHIRVDPEKLTAWIEAGGAKSAEKLTAHEEHE